MFNVCFGVLVLAKRDYDTPTVAIAAMLAVLGILPVLVFFGLATAQKENPISRSCVSPWRIEKAAGDAESEFTSLSEPKTAPVVPAPIVPWGGPRPGKTD